MNDRCQFRINILAAPPVRALLRQPALPLALQVAALAGVLFFCWNGWGLGLTQTESQLMTLRKTNLTTLFVWGLWWPGMIAVALLAGRLWCTVCPMELVSRLGHFVGRALGPSRLKLGPWLRAGWLVILAYLVLQVLVAGMSIHRVPHYTALMLMTLMGLALLAGLLFREERAFCKALCPAKALLSVYGRFTPLQLDVCDRAVCESCTTKDCVDPKKRDRFDARACPSLVRPYGRQKGDECVLCLQCAKVCPQNNVGWGLAAREAGSRRHRLLRPFEAAFVMFAAGFVAHDTIGEAAPLEDYFHFVPTLLNKLAPAIGFGWFEGLWFLVLVPVLLWLMAATLARLLGQRGTVRELLLAAATGAAPVVAVAHLAKALAKVSSWGGFLPLALREPAGLGTLERIAGKALAAPEPLVGLPLLGWVMAAALLAIAWRNRQWLCEAALERPAAARAGFAVCMVFYMAVLLAWPWV
ncbi:MAG: hypothetical protein M1438_04365 [Deltaproteobacteria bacterium]|nr:hypothetical protein [Deltaproteobacteria bacterium]